MWYNGYGIDFIYNSPLLRVINKRYYPFVKFADDTKI